MGEQQRIERERAAFVAAWREQHPGLVWITAWTCPLCLQVVQSLSVDAALDNRLVGYHQGWHGAAWKSYAAIGGES